MATDLPGPPEYLAYYGLARAPFGGAGSDRPWLGPTHRALLADLSEAIRHRSGVFLLTGEVGSGKTRLVSALVRGLDPAAVTVAVITGVGPEVADLQHAAARACGLPAPLAESSAFAPAFGERLDQVAREQRILLLVIDEAQRLGTAHFDAICDLVDARPGRGPRLLLVGQPDLAARVLEERHARIATRITARFVTEPLGPDEVAQYIRHRLDAAGCRTEVFSPDAIREVGRLSRGVPAVIDALCDRALLVGHRRQARVLRRHSIDDCWSGLGIPEPPAARPRAERQATRRAGTEARTQRRRPLTEARAVAPERASRRGPKVLIAALATAFLLMGGYSLYSRPTGVAHVPPPRMPMERASESEGASADRAEPLAETLIVAPSPAVTAATPPPAAAAPAPPREMRPARSADPVAPVPRPPAGERDAQGEARPAAKDVRPAARPSGEPKVPGSAAVPAPRASGGATVETRAAAEARGDASDGSSVIDWLLSEYPRKSR